MVKAYSALEVRRVITNGDHDLALRLLNLSANDLIRVEGTYGPNWELRGDIGRLAYFGVKNSRDEDWRIKLGYTDITEMVGYVPFTKCLIRNISEVRSRIGKYFSE